MAKRKNFYIKNKKVVEFIESKRNQSDYIESLVLKDMKSEKEILTKDKVIELIKKYSPSKIENTECVDLGVKESLNSLFDM